MLVVLVALLATAAYRYTRPIPALTAAPSLPAGLTAAPVEAAPSIPWPAGGSGALAISELGPVASSGEVKPAPMASIAKVMTAMIILQDKPLNKGDQGPAITIDAGAVAAYEADSAAGGSVVKVAKGEQLTEYQALQGLLIPSGNNIAELLATWDAGSVPAMVDRMNARAAALGLTHTTYADTSGFSPRTVSVPADLAVLGEKAMADPVFAEIVGQKQAELPVAGIVYNVDAIVGQDGVIGIKTGSSPEAGSCFLFAVSAQASGHPVTIYGAVMGLPLLSDAFAATKAIAAAARPAITMRHFLDRNQRVGEYRAPWGPRTRLVATAPVDLVFWPGLAVQTHLAPLKLAAPQPAAAAAGVLEVRLGRQVVRVPLATDAALAAPGLHWRVSRGLF